MLFVESGVLAVSEVDFESFDAFTEFAHTADVGIHVKGETLSALFANAARGMLALAGAEADAAQPAQRKLALEAPDAETLLVDWLSELAYFIEVEGAVFAQYEALQVTRTRLTTTLQGGAVASLQKQVKAVTYHGLQIVQRGEIFTATIIFDV